MRFQMNFLTFDNEKYHVAFPSESVYIDVIRKVKYEKDPNTLGVVKTVISLVSKFVECPPEHEDNLDFFRDLFLHVMDFDKVKNSYFYGFHSRYIVCNLKNYHDEFILFTFPNVKTSLVLRNNVDILEKCVCVNRKKCLCKMEAYFSADIEPFDKYAENSEIIELYSKLVLIIVKNVAVEYAQKIIKKNEVENNNEILVSGCSED